jgi:hypothetical protein
MEGRNFEELDGWMEFLKVSMRAWGFNIAIWSLVRRRRHMTAKMRDLNYRRSLNYRFRLI